MRTFKRLELTGPRYVQGTGDEPNQRESCFVRFAWSQVTDHSFYRGE